MGKKRKDDEAAEVPAFIDVEQPEASPYLHVDSNISRLSTVTPRLSMSRRNSRDSASLFAGGTGTLSARHSLSRPLTSVSRASSHRTNGHNGHVDFISERDGFSVNDDARRSIHSAYLRPLEDKRLAEGLGWAWNVQAQTIEQPAAIYAPVAGTIAEHDRHSELPLPPPSVSSNKAWNAACDDLADYVDEHFPMRPLPQQPTYSPDVPQMQHEDYYDHPRPLPIPPPAVAYRTPSPAYDSYQVASPPEPPSPTFSNRHRPFDEEGDPDLTPDGRVAFAQASPRVDGGKKKPKKTVNQSPKAVQKRLLTPRDRRDWRSKWKHRRHRDCAFILLYWVLFLGACAGYAVALVRSKFWIMDDEKRAAAGAKARIEGWAHGLIVIGLFCLLLMALASCGRWWHSYRR
ncbi:hypothetical protein PYCC9005_004020 [Savitreella phatthalungensis]